MTDSDPLDIKVALKVTDSTGLTNKIFGDVHISPSATFVDYKLPSTPTLELQIIANGSPAVLLNYPYFSDEITRVTVTKGTAPRLFPDQTTSEIFDVSLVSNTYIDFDVNYGDYVSYGLTACDIGNNCETSEFKLATMPFKTGFTVLETESESGDMTSTLKITNTPIGTQIFRIMKWTVNQVTNMLTDIDESFITASFAGNKLPIQEHEDTGLAYDEYYVYSVQPCLDTTTCGEYNATDDADFYEFEN